MRFRPRMALCVLLAMTSPPAAAAQERDNAEMTERAAVRALMDNRVTPERDRALSLALELGPRASPELRAAVIAAAWAEVHGETDRAEDDESFFSYMDAVAGLRDPRAAPLLVRFLAGGPGASNALADLGALAFPDVLEAVVNPGAHPHTVEGGLTALRFMLEDGSLGQREIVLVREAVANRMRGTQWDYWDFPTMQQRGLLGTTWVNLNLPIQRHPAGPCR